MRAYSQGSLANPAVGADIVDPTETTDSFRLVTFRATLHTSAAVANRFPHFRFTDRNGTVLHDVVAPAAQTAGLTVVYDLAGTGNAQAFTTNAVDGLCPLPLPDIRFPAGTKFSSLTTAIDVGDQWSAIVFVMLVGDEWEDLAPLYALATKLG